MSGVSGSENQLLELAAGLRNYGWRSDVLIPSPEPRELSGFVERLTTVCDRVELAAMRSDVSVGLVRRLVRALRSARYELAHAHLVHADWHLAVAGVLAPGIPLVTTKHNPDPFRTSLAFRVVERSSLKRYAAVIAISDALKEFLAETVRADAVTVRYGLSADQAPSREPREIARLLAAGRLVEQKGFDIAIEAMALVAAEAPGVQLEIAGEGSQRAALTAAIERLGIGSAVRLLGHRDDVDDLMLDADMFVHTARWEGFGLVLLEAMRAALPVVATGVGAIPEVVEDGVTGRLVPANDPQALADALLEHIRQPQLCRKRGLAGFARVRDRFPPEEMARGVAGIYDSLIAPRRPPQ